MEEILEVIFVVDFLIRFALIIVVIKVNLVWVDKDLNINVMTYEGYVEVLDDNVMM